MTKRFFAAVVLSLGMASAGFAQPGLTVAPAAMEVDNFVWEVSLSPDLVLAGGSTPLAVELGFKLTGAPLLSATNVNPTEWDTPNPGNVIFSWESLTDLDPGPGVNAKPIGLQVDTGFDEVFVAYGSVLFTTPGDKPFLKIVTQGPANGGSPTSTIEWLGAYNSGQGRVSQAVGLSGANFDVYSGSATQIIPEPAGAALLACGVLAGFTQRHRRRANRRGQRVRRD